MIKQLQVLRPLEGIEQQVFYIYSNNVNYINRFKEYHKELKDWEVYFKQVIKNTIVIFVQLQHPSSFEDFFDAKAQGCLEEAMWNLFNEELYF